MRRLFKFRLAEHVLCPWHAFLPVSLNRQTLFLRSYASTAIRLSFQAELAGESPADLEIDFELCAEPDALSRASELADQLHADVAVSPGILDRLLLERVGSSST